MNPSDSNNVNVADGTIRKMTTGEFEPVAGDENDTLMDEEHAVVQQWFNQHVKLSEEDNARYAELFVENGYDVVSAFRYINKAELETMGVRLRSHQTAILDAIKGDHNRRKSTHL